MVEETVNPDGTFEEPPVNDTFADEGAEEGAEEAAEVVKGIDPAFIFLGVVLVIAVAYVLLFKRKKQEDEDEFFSNLDGEKVCSEW